MGRSTTFTMACAIEHAEASRPKSARPFMLLVRALEGKRRGSNCNRKGGGVRPSGGQEPRSQSEDPAQRELHHAYHQFLGIIIVPGTGSVETSVDWVGNLGCAASHGPCSAWWIQPKYISPERRTARRTYKRVHRAFNSRCRGESRAHSPFFTVALLAFTQTSHSPIS